MVKRIKRERVRGGATFTCPICGRISRVTRTKRNERGQIVRERQCVNKRPHKFETVEVEAA